MKKKAKIGAVLCCSTALVGIVGGYLLARNSGLFNWGKTNIQTKQDYEIPDLVTGQDVENMSIALMNKTVNQNGSISYTYGYTISPNTTTRFDMTGALSFVGETNDTIGDFLTLSIDEANKSFTITKLADFSTQAQLVLSCNANPSVNATITFDCKQYFKGFSNVSEKTYKLEFDGNNYLQINNIKSDGANEINAANYSTAYTIPTYTGWRIEQATVSVTGYLTGDTIDTLVDSGLTIDENYAISQVNFNNDVYLSTLRDAVYADTALMPGTSALTFSQRHLFGVAYDITFIYNTSNYLKTFTAHMVLATDTSYLNFGLPTSLELESNAVTYENVETSIRFVYIDKNGETNYIDPVSANGTGWLSTGQRQFHKGYINVEVTHTLDGVAIDSPTLIYSINDGKGYYTGEDRTNLYIVYNPGGYENVRWVSQKTCFNEALYLLSNYAASTY